MAASYNMQMNMFGQNLGQYNSQQSNMGSSQDYYSSNIMPSLGVGSTAARSSQSPPYSHGDCTPYSNPGNLPDPSLMPINSATDLEQLITATQKLYVTLVK